MSLTPLQVRQVCLAGTPCRYLETVWQKGGAKNMCMKLAPHYYAEHKKKLGIKDDSNLGNNCQGYLYLRHKKQGIDV